MNNRDCKHGQLARSCEICELEGELATLREKAKGIEDFYNRWRHLGVDTNADILWQAIKNFVEGK